MVISRTEVIDKNGNLIKSGDIVYIDSFITDFEGRNRYQKAKFISAYNEELYFVKVFERFKNVDRIPSTQCLSKLIVKEIQ